MNSLVSCKVSLSLQKGNMGIQCTYTLIKTEYDMQDLSWSSDCRYNQTHLLIGQMIFTKQEYDRMGGNASVRVQSFSY